MDPPWLQLNKGALQARRAHCQECALRTFCCCEAGSHQHTQVMKLPLFLVARQADSCRSSQEPTMDSVSSAALTLCRARDAVSSATSLAADTTLMTREVHPRCSPSWAFGFVSCLSVGVLPPCVFGSILLGETTKFEGARPSRDLAQPSTLASRRSVGRCPTYSLSAPWTVYGVAEQPTMQDVKVQRSKPLRLLRLQPAAVPFGRRT